LYRSLDIVWVNKSRSLRCVALVARTEEGRTDFKILKGKPAGSRLLERPKHRWKNNIRIDLKGTTVNRKNWIDSAQDRNYWRALVRTLHSSILVTYY
jgi:hypothetical protein